MTNPGSAIEDDVPQARRHTPEAIRDALATIDRYAHTVEEADEFAAMLGIGGTKAACTKCGKPMSRRTNLGRHAGAARERVCGPCVKKARKAEQNAAARKARLRRESQNSEVAR